MATALQLILFGDENQQQTFDVSFSWADGDESPVQLARLGQVLKGRREVLGRPASGHIIVRVLDTRIEDGHVIATCERDVALERELGMHNGAVEDDDI